MTLAIIDKDITTVTEGVIVHQVNCAGVMGAGVAKAIANKWPIVKKEYEGVCSIHTAGSLFGNIQVVQVDPQLWIVNLFGQLKPDTTKRATSYDAVASGFSILSEWWYGESDLSDVYDLYVPYLMGCGLGGGEWDIYSAIIEHYIPETRCCKI